MLWMKDKKRLSPLIVELAELVLRNNIFEFNSRFYKQKQCTSIGTKMAPPYEILFLDYFFFFFFFLFMNTKKLQKKKGQIQNILGSTCFTF